MLPRDEEDMTTAYKVVRVEDSKYFSCTVNGVASVEYAIDKVSHAPDHLARHNYHILVFNRLVDAVNFISTRIGWNNAAVLECECTEKVELPSYLSSYIGEYDEDDIRHMIENCRRLSGWPRGTVMFKSVKPIREVSKKEAVDCAIRGAI